jgi:hypothetical protein
MIPVFYSSAANLGVLSTTSKAVSAISTTAF